MSPNKLATIAAASMLLMGAGTAFAKNDAKGSANASEESQKPKKTDVGPKNGFPENHGMEVAREHANEHAAFNRHDSPGT